MEDPRSLREAAPKESVQTALQGFIARATSNIAEIVSRGDQTQADLQMRQLDNLGGGIHSVIRDQSELAKLLGPERIEEDLVDQYRRHMKVHHPDPEHADSCELCGVVEGTQNVKLSRCSRCRTARFCNKSCQVLAWKQGRHKEDCFDAQSFLSPT